MKFNLLPLILLIFLASCTMTKRKYASGYYLNWKHSAPNALQSTKQNIAIIRHNNPVSVTSSELNAGVNQPLTQTIGLAKPTLFQQTKQYRHNLNFSADLNNPVNLKYPEIIFPVNTPIGSEKNKLEVCKEANASLILGILSLAIPLFILVLSFFIAVSEVGDPLAGFLVIFALEIDIPIFLVFGLLAIILGSTALNKINKEPKKYTGKTKAEVGILIPLSLVFILILFTIIIRIFTY